MLEHHDRGKPAGQHGVDHLLEPPLMDAVGVEQLELDRVVQLRLVGRQVQGEEPVLVEQVRLRRQGRGEHGQGLAHELVLEVLLEYGGNASQLRFEVADQLIPLQKPAAIHVELVQERPSDPLVYGLEGVVREPDTKQVVENNDRIQIRNA